VKQKVVLSELTLGKIEDFLECIPSKHTRKNYKFGIKRFEEWHGSSITALINSPQATRKIEKFFVALKQKHPQNTCRNLTNSAIQFLKYFGTDVRPRRALGIYRTEKAIGEHKLSIEEVQRMSTVADLKEQILLEILLLGFRIGDVIRLKVNDFKRLDLEAPIEFKIRATKEGTIYETFISEEFKERLKLYLPTIESDWLFPGIRKGSHVKDETLNNLLRSLAERAGVKLYGRLHWHSGRKLVMRTGGELGISPWIVKKMVGKSIPRSDDAYLSDMNLKKGFLELKKLLKLDGRNNGNTSIMKEELDNFKIALTSVEKENLVLKTRLNNLQDNTLRLENRLDQIGDLVAHNIEFGHYSEEEKNAIRKKYRIKEFSEEEKELLYAYQRIFEEVQGPKGHLDPEDMKEVERRYQAFLREWVKTHKLPPQFEP